MSITPKTNLIKALYSLDSSRPNGRLSQNPKTERFRELFIPENDFKTSSTVNFSKKHPDCGGLETNWRHEIQTWIFFFTFPSTYELIIVFWALNRNNFLIAISFEGKIFKKSAEKALRNWILQFSELYISGSANPRNIFNRLELLLV